MSESDDRFELSQSFMDHLVELRKRLIYSVCGVGLGFSLSYSYAEKVFDILLEPLCKAFQRDQCPIVYTSLVEPFLVYLKVGILGGFFLAVPWIFIQVWQFISPGLKAAEKKYVVPFVTVASVMFVFGGCLGYFFLFPMAFKFFLSIVPTSITPMLSMSDYFSLASGLLIAFGVLFEIPVFVVLLNLIGVLSSRSLWKTWRIAVALIFVLSAVLTPADPYTMLLMGVPLSVLYIAALVVCSLLEKARSH
jgi:sec-independent protein translocase protein TatC